MEPITAALLVILGIYGTGFVNKAGEDTWDKGRQYLTRKLQGTATAKALASGQEPDLNQAVIDVEAITADPEIESLKVQIQMLLSQNEDFKKQVEAMQKKTIQVNKDKSQGYLFTEKVETKFFGGIHYHMGDPSKED
jgi:hypothetical protein